MLSYRSAQSISVMGRFKQIMRLTKYGQDHHYLQPIKKKRDPYINHRLKSYLKTPEKRMYSTDPLSFKRTLNIEISPQTAQIPFLWFLLDRNCNTNSIHQNILIKKNHKFERERGNETEQISFNQLHHWATSCKNQHRSQRWV